MELYNSSEITVHQLNELRQGNKKIQIIDVRDDTEKIMRLSKDNSHEIIRNSSKTY